MRTIIYSILLSVILFAGFYNIENAYAQGVDTAGGVNVPGTWYVGEGLKHGDYFEYRLCELDLNDCAPIIMKMWVKGDRQKATETFWDVDTVVIDGNKIVKGNMGLGTVVPEPIDQTENLFYYSRALKSSIVWLSAFTTGDESDFIHGPKSFTQPAWGKIGAIGGSQLIPKRAETITTPIGTLDTVVVGWYSGENNDIWILDDFPFPVKGLAYAWVTTGIAPIMFDFEILKYEENVTSDPFVDVVGTIDEKALIGCPTKLFDYVGESQSTNTFSMKLEYSYAPKNPKVGCDIDFKINFKNKYNENEFVDQVHYDLWVVDDKGNKLRSHAEEIGRDELFTGFGQAHISFTVKEPPGENHYAIFVYGVSPQSVEPPGDLAGYTIIDVDIVQNSKVSFPDAKGDLDIPPWIKNNAKWWSEGQIDDTSFVSGIQYLINQDIMKIPSTSQGTGSGSNDIPPWIKNNADWWANGLISDDDFVSGIQYLIQNGIMRIN